MNAFVTNPEPDQLNDVIQQLQSEGNRIRRVFQLRRKCNFGHARIFYSSWPSISVNANLRVRLQNVADKAKMRGF
jgi:hypothetical protein